MVNAVQNRIRALFPAFAIMAGFVAAFPSRSVAENSTGLSYQAHWLANTSGQPGSHIQNFIEDMSVIYVSDKQFPGPMVVTKSFWDEGGRPNAVYQDGRRIGFNLWKDRTDSRTAVYQGDTCRILNFYGRSFLFKLAPPPSTPDSSPRVSCTDGSTIASIEDPTALAFDRAGRLLIGDNGPDQNVKIFTRVPGGWLRSGAFGETGGVFAGPVRGAAGPRRFWGIRGLGVDSAGNLYVGCTGIPMQTMGGTDIRVFSAKDSSLLWNVQGLSFVNSADADPASEAGSVFLNAKRFRMDWRSPPGKSWSLAETLRVEKYRTGFGCGVCVSGIHEGKSLHVPQERGIFRRKNADVCSTHCLHRDPSAPDVQIPRTVHPKAANAPEAARTSGSPHWACEYSPRLAEGSGS
jgi:hypothetical protein